MDYKEKYKKALKRARKLYEQGTITESLSYVFPELKESEDEKIKKAIIEFFESEDDNTTYSLVPKKDIIAWLEKQGEKPAGKVEPKFHEGEWVVFNSKHQSIYQVEKIEDGYYILRHTHGGTFRVCILHDENLRLWTIQDAKDGDVLYSPCLSLLWIFKSIDTVYCGCNLNYNDGAFCGEGYFERPTDAIPATKEQYDTFFAKLKEAGYEWDAEKKEPKKIEQNPAWSEEDERLLNATINTVLISRNSCEEDDDVKDRFDDELNWLKSLKERIKG